jgi:hypothetical protein
MFLAKLYNIAYRAARLGDNERLDDFHPLFISDIDGSDRIRTLVWCLLATSSVSVSKTSKKKNPPVVFVGSRGVGKTLFTKIFERNIEQTILALKRPT